MSKDNKKNKSSNTNESSENAVNNKSDKNSKKKKIEKSDAEVRADVRHKRRIRNQVFAYFVLLIIIGGIGVGGYFGVQYLTKVLNDKTSTQPDQIVSTSDNSALAEEAQPIISSPEEFIEEEPVVEEEPVKQENEQARAYIDSMQLEQKIANLFIVRPEDIMEGVDIEYSYGDKTAEAIDTYAVGAFLYSDRNITSTDDNFIKLLEDTGEHYKTTYNVPLWVMYDGDRMADFIDKGVDFYIAAAESYEGPIGKEISCVKSFPMQDGTNPGTIEDSAENIRTDRFPYFSTAIGSGANAIFVSNVLAPNVSGDGLPCSLSYGVITEILRNELGFDGIVITDFLNDPSITGNYSSSEAAIKAISAGADLLLCPDNFLEAYDAVLTEVQNGNISEERIDESLMRIFALRYERQQ